MVWSGTLHTPVHAAAVAGLLVEKGTPLSPSPSTQHTAAEAGRVRSILGDHRHRLGLVRAMNHRLIGCDLGRVLYLIHRDYFFAAILQGVVAVGI